MDERKTVSEDVAGELKLSTSKALTSIPLPNGCVPTGVLSEGKPVRLAIAGVDIEEGAAVIYRCGYVNILENVAGLTDLTISLRQVPSLARQV